MDKEDFFVIFFCNCHYLSLSFSSFIKTCTIIYLQSLLSKFLYIIPYNYHKKYHNRYQESIKQFTKNYSKTSAEYYRIFKNPPNEKSRIP